MHEQLMMGTDSAKHIEGAPRRLLLLLGLVAMSTSAVCREFSATITAASEYIYRGQSLSGRNPALQAGIDYEHESGLFAGAWASTVDLENLGGRRDVEVDYYAGYAFPATTALDLSVTVMRYTYPGQSTYFDYDYTELLVSATLHDRHSIEAGFSDNVYGYGANGRYAELRSNWPMRNAWVVSAGLGYNVLEDQGTSNYWFGDVGASARLGRFMLDVRYYDNEAPSGGLADLSAGSRLVVSVSAGF